MRPIEGAFEIKIVTSHRSGHIRFGQMVGSTDMHNLWLKYGTGHDE